VDPVPRVVAVPRPKTAHPRAGHALTRLARIGAWFSHDRSAWLAWLCVGLALRCVLLPLTTHPDMLAVYYRAGMLESGAASLADHPLQTLPMTLHWAWVRLLALPTPNLVGLPWPDATTREVLTYGAESLKDPAALGWVALWKLPYLLGDLACAFALVRLVDPADRRRTFALWMLHPIVIFVGMGLGKYECWMLLPLLLGLGSLRRQRPIVAFLWIGIAIAMRLYPALLLLPLVLATTSDTSLRLRQLGVGLLPTAVAVAIGCTQSQGLRLVVLVAAVIAVWLAHRRLATGLLLAAYAVALLAGVAIIGPRLLTDLQGEGAQVGTLVHHGSFFGRTGLGNQNPILLFVVAYGVVCVWAHRRSSARVDGANVLADAISAGFLASLCFCSFAFFNPQYVVLLVPFALLVAPRLADGLPAHALQVAGVLLCVLGWSEGMTSLRLLLPLAPAEISWTRAPLEVLGTAIADFDWISIGRTSIAMGSLWMAWDLLRQPARAVRPMPVPGAWFLTAAGAWPIGIASLCWIGLCGGGNQPLGEPELLPEPWVSAAHPERLQIDTRLGAPTRLEILPTRLTELAQLDGMRLTIVAADASAEAAAEPQVLWLPQASIVDPLRDDLIRIDLSEALLEPDRRYDIELSDERNGVPSGAVMQQLREVPTDELRSSALATARQRLFESSPLGWCWLAAIGGCLGLAAWLGWRSRE
jgi:hypothetical protein